MSELMTTTALASAIAPETAQASTTAQRGRLMTEQELSEKLELPLTTFASWRKHCRGINYVVVAKGQYRYWEHDVDAWMQARTVQVG